MLRQYSIRAMQLLAMMILPSVALAQSGRIVGRVTDAQGAGIAGVQLLASPAGVSAASGSDGRFTIRGVTIGAQSVRAYRFGYRQRTIAGVTVSANADARLDIRSSTRPTLLGGVVTSASRRVEKITDAPATITRLDEAQIENTIGNSFAAALKEVKGARLHPDRHPVGCDERARTSTPRSTTACCRWRTAASACWPESGLPVGSLDDGAEGRPRGRRSARRPRLGALRPGRVERRRHAPDEGSARSTRGTTLEVDGGTRSFYDVQGRHAGVAGNVRLQAHRRVRERRTTSRTTMSTARRDGATDADSRARRQLEDGRRRAAPARSAVLTDGGSPLRRRLGVSKLNGIGPTNVGRNQLAELRLPRRAAQVHGPALVRARLHVASRSGHDVPAERAARRTRLRFPTISDDSVKALSAFPGDGRLQAAEIQNNFSIGMLARRASPRSTTHFTSAASCVAIDVSSDGTWLERPRRRARTSTINQQGRLRPARDAVTSRLLASRLARPLRQARLLRRAVVAESRRSLFTPITDQTFRVTYNRAFKSPTHPPDELLLPELPAVHRRVRQPQRLRHQERRGHDGQHDRPDRARDQHDVGARLQGRRRQQAVRRRRRATARTSTSFMSPLVVIANPLTRRADATTAYNHADGREDHRRDGRSAGPADLLQRRRATFAASDAGLRFYFTPTRSPRRAWQPGRRSTRSIRKATDPLRRPPSTARR